MKRLFLKIGKAFMRFALRHWAGTLIVILLLLAALTGFQMWRLGPVMALSLFPQFVICLILIAGVIGIRRMMKALSAKNVVESGVAQGRTVLKSTAEEAKETLAALSADMKRDLGRLVGAQVAPTAAPQRCPSCGRPSQPGAKFCEGCGAPLLVTCPRCARALRPEARFCDACGAPVRGRA